MMKFTQNKLDQSRRIFSRERGTLVERDGTYISKPKVSKETVNAVSLATLLYSGIVFPPDTIFSDFWAVGMGGTLSTDGTTVEYVEAEDLFESHHDESEIDPIDSLAKAMDVSGVDLNQCLLLLSEGKDSTGIAIALAELGVKADCLTFANSDTNVELVTDIAKRFGHRLEVVRYDDFTIPESSLESLANVFEPSVDQAFLSYLLLPQDRFQNRTVIDGMGNDLYMGHLPTKQQLLATKVCNAVNLVSPKWFSDSLKGKCFQNSERCGIPFRSFSECQGFYNGFDRNLIRKLIAAPRSLDFIDQQWKSIGFEKARALSRGRYLDTYSFSGKSISLAEMASAKIYFPWADEKVALQFGRLSPDAKYQWPTINKLPLREAINRRFNYQQPKVGFRAPVQEILAANRQLLQSAVDESDLIPDPIKRQAFTGSKYENRLVACALLALWERANK